MAWFERWPNQRRLEERGGLSWREFVQACRDAKAARCAKSIRKALVAAGLRTQKRAGEAGYTTEMIDAVRAYAGRKGLKKQEK